MSLEPYSISDTILIDIAVLSQEYSPIEIECTDNNIVELDDILISEEVFKSIFYPHGENFGIVNEMCRNNSNILEYITFFPPWRTINGNKFLLLEQIILNLEKDLNVTRNCFTTTSLIELSHELSNITSLCDLNCCSLVTSLPWSNIQNIIKTNYKMHSNNEIQVEKHVLLVISIIFKTPNIGVRPTIIKFKYRIVLNQNR